jgi:ABC-type uncharacterized transport system permease subunit
MLLGFGAYLIGTVCFLGYLANRREALARAGYGAVAAGFVAHLASYGGECAATRAMVVTSLHGSFSFLALVCVLVLLVIALRHQLLILGAFVMPLATIFAGVAAFSAPVASTTLPLGGPWFPVHVIASYLGFAGFNAAFGVAIAYLIQERQLKSRHLGGIAYLLPPLDALDRLGVMLTRLSVAIIGLGILSGMGFAHATTGTWWVREPKATATVVSWLIYVGALLLRRFAGWRGRKMAWLLVGGFVLVLVTFAGINHVLPAVPPPIPG